MAIPIKNLVLDMDGVLWHGERPVPGLPEFFDSTRRLGINFVLATNNATKTVDEYVAKLARFGVDVTARQILTSAEVTGDYLLETFGVNAKIYCIGQAGLIKALTRRGFRLVGRDQVTEGQTVDLVVVGLSRQANYEDFAAATLLIDRGAAFIGTNPDVSFPSEFGPMPGAGAFLALISAATGVEAETVGKPGPTIFRHAVERLEADSAETAMVGDRLSTDIVGGHQAGLQTILVLSGVSSRDDAAHNGIRPDYIFEDIGDLARNLPGLTQR